MDERWMRDGADIVNGGEEEGRNKKNLSNACTAYN
jgi:hypothetical protein